MADLILTGQQEEVVKQFTQFIHSDELDTMIIRGSAGTGKTTLIKHLISKLKKQKKSFELLATTGRAAKILGQKTKETTSTIHSCLYIFDKIENEENLPDEDSHGQLFIKFGTKPQDPSNTKPVIYFIDESSMISGLTNKSTYTVYFGTGNLLQDLFNFVRPIDKIVFVGDICQLPPIQGTISMALEPTYLDKKFNRKTTLSELTEVIRQAQGSNILKMATIFRDRILGFTEMPIRPRIPVTQYRSNEVVLLRNLSDLFRRYFIDIQGQNYAKATIVCYSNNQVFKMNGMIRANLNYPPNSIHKGELLMVYQNNLITGLKNGDQIKVINVGKKEKVGKHNFINLEVQSIDTKKSYSVIALENFIFDAAPSLNKQQTQDLLINFDNRMKRSRIRRNSELYKQKMQIDPYLNAIRAKFGYAMTSHKSQGGEWDHIYVNLWVNIYNQKPKAVHQLLYTIITRAKKKIHFSNGSWIS